MVVAETNRLVLEKFTTEDAPFFLELVNTPNWIKYIGDRNTKTIFEAKQRIKEDYLISYKTNGFGLYKVLLKEEKLKPIGTCGLIKRDTLDYVDLGFALLPDYENKGFGYEAALAAINLAHETFNLKQIAAITLPNNEPSIKLLKKLEFTYLKKVITFDNETELMLFLKNLM